MKNNKYKHYSLASLIIGYTMSVLFIMLIIFNLKTDEQQDVIIKLVETNNTIVQEKLVYVTGDQPHVDYIDHLPQTIYTPRHDVRELHSTTDIIIDNAPGHRTITGYDNNHDTIDTGVASHHSDYSKFNNKHVNKSHDIHTRDKDTRDTSHVTDHGLLDRRLHQLQNNDNIPGSKNDIDLSKLSVVNDNDDGPLGELGDFKTTSTIAPGAGGQLYAYNHPGQGVGAGIGTSSIGAGGGATAGISAGVGEGLADGSTVPTLGGVGTYMSPDNNQIGGSGGLVSGAGAGSAAGLYNGTVMVKLGPPGSSGAGTGGRGTYDHLPRDGALHIMMHVDGSGSILNTRKQLEIMRDTLLKQALLPYYNNDIELYNKRVTIVDGSGERTFKFFTDAAKKDNVLALVFQDEAQPSYHLPNFNKKPESHYVTDLENLKASLTGYKGVYRGVMFQVDRGNTFAKSFKEFVNNSFLGQGYLSQDNLKKYHRDNNLDNITNKSGVVFSDEYHAKDSGDPAYYLNLIRQAALKVGLNLSIEKGGLHDGKHI